MTRNGDNDGDELTQKVLSTWPDSRTLLSYHIQVGTTNYWVAYEQQKIIFHSSGDWESKVRVPAGSGAAESLFCS